MKEYILNINFKNWQNQLWFISENSSQIEEKWKIAIKEIDLLKNSCKEPQEFQNKVIKYLKNLGFIRIQK